MSKPIKPGDLSGHNAMIKSQDTAEKTAKEILKSAKVPVTKQLTKGDARGPGKHYKGIYN